MPAMTTRLLASRLHPASTRRSVPTSGDRPTYRASTHRRQTHPAGWAPGAGVLHIATSAQFAQMLDAAQEGGHAYPAIDDYGAIEMNVDSDTQHAFTRPIVDHVMKSYDGALEIDGEVGNKKVYDRVPI